MLVVGGSLVGLSAAVFLSWWGVPTTLVERHLGSSPHPRAVGFTPRTSELFRAVGLGPRLPRVPPGPRRPRRAWVESLAGEWYEELPWTPGERETFGIEYSPCGNVGLSQDRLEPILRERAVELGSDLRLGTELLRFEQDADGVTARLRGRDGHESVVRAAYLIAADGHRSPVREALGIGRAGRGHLRTGRSVLFLAPLEEYLRTGIRQFSIDQPGFAAFLTTRGDGRWVLFFLDDEERNEETLRASVVKAIGRSDVPVEIVTAGRWEVSALVADRFAWGRVFLAGDAAHTLPPNRGGYGVNTGIEDAHNLAWKVAAMLSGVSAPQLLDTYDAERRPIAWLRHGQIFARPDADGTEVDAPLIDDAAMEFGQLYRSTAVIGADDGLPPALRPEQWAGQPGTRAPHLWVTRDGERVSTLDLLGRGWVLLAEGGHWGLAAERAGEARGVEVEFLRVGVDVKPDDPEAFREAFGLKTTGASLVRPDGYVAWCSIGMPADPTRALTDALGQASRARTPVERR